MKKKIIIIVYFFCSLINLINFGLMLKTGKMIFLIITIVGALSLGFMVKIGIVLSVRAEILGKWTNGDEDVIEFFEDDTCTVEAIFPESHGSSKYVILKEGKIKITSMHNDVKVFNYLVKKDEIIIDGKSFFKG